MSDTGYCGATTTDAHDVVWRCDAIVDAEAHPEGGHFASVCQLPNCPMHPAIRWYDETAPQPFDLHLFEQLTEQLAKSHTLRYESDGDYCERTCLECSCEDSTDVALTLETETDWRTHFATEVAIAFLTNYAIAINANPAPTTDQN